MKSAAQVAPAPLPVDPELAHPSRPPATRGGLLRRYAHWLHLKWPDGDVEKLPVVNADFSTEVEGLYVAGDLVGIPLLKFAIDSGARAMRTLAATLEAGRAQVDRALDVAIIGGGVAGVSAALEARRLGLSFTVIEATEPLATIRDLPKNKPIYTYPTRMEPLGALRIGAGVKEQLLAELDEQLVSAELPIQLGRAERIVRKGEVFEVALADAGHVRARRVLVAIGRSGEHRRLGASGEGRAHVFHRLVDAAEHGGQRVLVVGGGDSAVEAAIALAEAGAAVTLSYRGATLSRPKPANLEQLEARRGSGPGLIEAHFKTELARIEQDSAVLLQEGAELEVSAEVVFILIGRDAPLDFFRRAGVSIRGELRTKQWAALGAFLVFCTLLYDWKSGGFLYRLFSSENWFPFSLAAHRGPPGSLSSVLAVSASKPGFYYTLAYSLLVTAFGIKRMRKRRTPYVTAQTTALIAIQVVPLFLLPELLLPLLDANGLLPAAIAELFPKVNYGHGREFWRAYGFVLAWPLMLHNVFTSEPLTFWLTLSFIQTFVLIPLGVWRWGKGFYCGWICSCGALAETLGDAHREKMPHGAKWNRLNLAGQVLLAVALGMLVLRIAGWLLPGKDPIEVFFSSTLMPSWKWGVDIGLAGILGVGLYFWFSGRTWCRFFCPLAALMHVYARFSRFRIFAEKKRCISCNVCTTVCHQGIDVMSFASRGAPMEDPQCVRCSACVSSCPTGVLEFGRLRADGSYALDVLSASNVRRHEAESRASNSGGR